MNNTSPYQDVFWAVSDLHLHPSRPKAIEHFRAFLQKASHQTSNLVILGDLFDYWVGPYDFHQDDFSNVFHALYEAQKNGLNLSFVAGNRDFLARHDLNKLLRIPTFRDRWCFENKNIKWIGVHGDTLCHMDTSYQCYRRLIQTDFIGQAVQSFPDWLKARIIKDLRNVSQEKIEKMNDKQKHLSRYRIRSIMCNDANHLICGHVHDPGHYQIEIDDKMRSIWILGDWINPEDCTYFVANSNNSKLATF